MRRVLAVAGLVVAVAVGVWAELPPKAPALVEVGTIGDLPPAGETIKLHVLEDGTLRVNDKERSFVWLRTNLNALRKPSPPFKGSPTNVLLYTDKKLPWQAVQWILTACAEEKLNRIFHAHAISLPGGL